MGRTKLQKENKNETSVIIEPQKKEIMPEDDVKDLVVGYFEDCKKTKNIPQIADLLIVLGITREEWSKYAELYPVIVNRANHYIEARWVDFLKDSRSASGAMFYLKNMFNEIYRDKQLIPDGDGNMIQVNFIQFNGSKKTN